MFLFFYINSNLLIKYVSKMGKMTIDISDELDDQFREKVFNRFGMKKGNLTLAIEEALKDWINKGSEKKDE